MKNSPFFSLLIVAVVAGGILGGAFVGGVAMGKTQGSTDTASVAATPRPTTQSSQSNASGSQASQQPQSTQSSTQQQARQQFGQGGQGAGGTTVGTVSKVDGNVVTLTTAQGTTVNVQLSPDTTIEKTVTGSAADLKDGVSVTVSGQRGADGAVTASSITVLPAGTQFPGGFGGGRQAQATPTPGGTLSLPPAPSAATPGTPGGTRPFPTRRPAATATP